MKFSHFLILEVALNHTGVDMYSFPSMLINLLTWLINLGVDMYSFPSMLINLLIWLIRLSDDAPIGVYGDINYKSAST